MAMIEHEWAFRRRRLLNWFPMGMTYAFLYMGRYNLTVAKNALGELMTKEDFGLIFGAGTVTYAIAFLLNGPLVDRMGGRKGILIAAFGAMAANALMGAFLLWTLGGGDAGVSITLVFVVLYSANMYFQSFGAVSIVKVNAHWFHVSERGGFSGIFGTMISSGIWLAFTVNGRLLEAAESIFGGPSQWVVFFAPALLLGVMGVTEVFLLRDRPGQAGHTDFDTGDASSDDESDEPLPVLVIFKRLLTNPIILTVAGIEFCTGVLRNGVMHWFPFYAKEVWALADNHALRYGEWEHVWVSIGCFVVAAVSFGLAGFAKGSPRRGWLMVLGALAFLAPFMQDGWGGLLFVAGVIGANVAGWVSDVFFGSRRGPSVAMLYGLLALCTLAMSFVLAPSTSVVEWAAPDSGLEAGDEILAIAGEDGVEGWAEVARAVACVPATCDGSGWDREACICSSGVDHDASVRSPGVIVATVLRDGEQLEIELADPKPEMRAGDTRKLAARPVLPMSPFLLGAVVFFMSLAVIGSHGLLSGTATMDFGGRKAAATAVGLIDGFVYLGTGLQAFALGYLTSEDWSYWPWFLLPFAVVGTILCFRIWHAHPDARRKGAKK
jgi:OPA family glycerol-3-phosphate transporter-like MFS transporter